MVVNSGGYVAAEVVLGLVEEKKTCCCCVRMLLRAFVSIVDLKRVYRGKDRYKKVDGRRRTPRLRTITINKFVSFFIFFFFF